jgi:hypothetical protein
MQNFDHYIVFWEKRQIFAENWEKSQKIVIITSTPGPKTVFSEAYKDILMFQC